MNINFTGHHMDLTDSLRDYASKRFERLAHYYDKIMDIDVTLEVNKNQVNHTATVALHIPHASKIYAESTSEDMYASIDEVYDKLKRQIEKFKDKIQDKTKDPERT